MYLGFVMTLQLDSFFTIAATALWISKLTEDAVRRAAENYSLYLAGFIVTVLVRPFCLQISTSPVLTFFFR